MTNRELFLALIPTMSAEQLAEVLEGIKLEFDLDDPTADRSFLLKCYEAAFEARTRRIVDALDVVHSKLDAQVRRHSK